MLTSAQLELRKNGIGSSEIAAILGRSRFATPLSVYASKTEDLPQPSSDAMDAGNFFEGSIAKWYAKRQGVQLTGVQPTLVHPEHPWMLATVDRLAVSGRARKPYRVVEIKHVINSVSAEEWGEEGTDEAPEPYLLQVAHQLEVVHALHGIEEAHIVVSLFGRAPRVYPVQRDPELGAIVTEAARAFWFDHVVARVPPALDGSEAAHQWLARRFPKSSGAVVGASADSLKWFRQVGAANAAKKEAERQLDEAKAYLKLEIGDRGGIEGPLGRALWGTRKSNINWESYSKSLGGTDAGAEAFRPDPTRSLRVTVQD